MVSEMIAGARPRRTSVKANEAVSVATARSQAPTMPMPPARTCPVIRAITGLSSSMTAVSSPVIAAVASDIDPPPASDRSAPEQKTRPVWVSTTARTPRSCPAAVRLPVS